MRKRKNTALLISKLPEPGEVKTRLTRARGGMLSPETASGLYHCMLLDVVETIVAALDELEAMADGRPASGGLDDGNTREGLCDSYDFIILADPQDRAAPMRELLARAQSWSRDIEVIAKRRMGFGEKYNVSMRYCFERGADCALVVRGDLPALTKADVTRAFQQLHEVEPLPQGGLVLASDGKLSVSLVGETRRADFSHEGIFDKGISVSPLSNYITKAAAAGLPVRWLPSVPDVDTMEDLAHSALLIQAKNYAARFDDFPPSWRTAAALYQLGFREVILDAGASHSEASG